MIVFVNDPKRTVISLSIPAEDVVVFKNLLKGYNLSFVREEKKKGRIILHDISGPIRWMSCLLGTIEDSEAAWDAGWCNGLKNIYILVGGRRKGGKKYEHGSEDRGEVREGSESGDPEGADPDSGHGEADPVGGNCDPDRPAGAGTAEGAEEGPGTLDDCE